MKRPLSADQKVWKKIHPKKTEDKSCFDPKIQHSKQKVNQVLVHRTGYLYPLTCGNKSNVHPFFYLSQVTYSGLGAQQVIPMFRFVSISCPGFNFQLRHGYLYLALCSSCCSMIAPCMTLIVKCDKMTIMTIRV